MASDAVPESLRYGHLFTIMVIYANSDPRSGVFVVMSTGLVVGTLLSGPAIYYLISSGEWPAIFMSLGFQVLGLITTVFIPETLSLKNGQSDTSSLRGQTSFTYKIRTGSQELLTKSFKSLRDIFWSDSTVTLFIFSLLFIDVGEDIGSIITKQYAAKRFSLTWPEVWKLQYLPVKANYRARLALSLRSKASHSWGYALLHYPSPKRLCDNLMFQLLRKIYGSLELA